MADQNILKAQKYLNSMYGHRSEWVKIDEDGITGVKLCQRNYFAHFKLNMV